MYWIQARSVWNEEVVKMPTAYIRKKKPKQKRKPKQEKTEKKSEGLGDIKNVTEGSVNLVEGCILVVRGMFKLLGFSLAMCVDGIKWIFDKDDKSVKGNKGKKK